MKNFFQSTVVGLSLVLMAGSAGAAPLTPGATNPGELNGGNLSVAVTGMASGGCIDFYTATQGCGTASAFTVGVPVDTALFVGGSTATIQDIPGAASLPISKFLTLTNQVGGATIYFDLTGIVVQGSPCTISSTSCTFGDFIFFQVGNNVTVQLTVTAKAYTGSLLTGYTPYSITFTSQFLNTTIVQLINLAATGAITNSVSFTANPSGPPVIPFNGCTVTQGGWGAAPHGNNAGAQLVNAFPSVYPAGVTIGVSGVPGLYSLHFDHASNVEAFLPQGGTPGPLTFSATDPTSSSAGVFAGQVLALELNVDLDGLGSAVLTGTGTSLDGKTVSQILAAANLALAGGALPSGFTYSSLNDLVDNLNMAFDNCSRDSWASSHLI